MADYPYLIDTNAHNAATALNNKRETMASSLARHRINVNCVSGWISTQGERKFTPDWEEVDRTASSHCPEALEKRDIANAVNFCSAEADYITGMNLKVDGGFGISQRVVGLHKKVEVPVSSLHENKKEDLNYTFVTPTSIHIPSSGGLGGARVSVV